MDKELLLKAKNIITARNEKVVFDNQKIKELLKNNSTYIALDNEKTSLLLLLLKENTNSASIMGEIIAIDNQINELINKLGMKFNDYYCNDCNDTGSYDGNFCECLKSLYKQLYNESLGLNNLPPFTFAEHNKLKSNNASLNKLYDGLENYCDIFPLNKKNKILLHGSVGAGKSYLVSAIANSISNKGYIVRYVSAYTMNDVFLRCHTSFTESRQSILAPLVECDLLIIDDLGTEPLLNNVTVPYLYILLEARKNKHTIITTNLDPHSEIQSRYNERIYSRIVDKEHTGICKINGQDMRRN